jgi:hypothetical protein
LQKHKKEDYKLDQNQKPTKKSQDKNKNKIKRRLRAKIYEFQRTYPSLMEKLI